jgi:transcriptional regulator with PAS, ATPase and Fis domain
MKKLPFTLLPKQTTDNISVNDMLKNLEDQITFYNEEEKRLHVLIMNQYKKLDTARKNNVSLQERKLMDEEMFNLYDSFLDLVDASQTINLLSKSIDRCRDASKSKALDEIALSFYLLGTNANALSTGVYDDAKEEMFKAYVNQKKQLQALEYKHHVNDSIKRQSHSIAQEEWKENPTIRITMMAEHTLAMLRKRYVRSLGSLPTLGTIRNWIREIAPPQASVRGRPSKK